MPPDIYRKLLFAEVYAFSNLIRTQELSISVMPLFVCYKGLCTTRICNGVEWVQESRASIMGYTAGFGFSCLTSGKALDGWSTGTFVASI